VKFRELKPDLAENAPDLDWEEVDRHLDESAQRIRVRRVNGTGQDTLAYWDHPEGMQVIAIGGDKLSRGLTLEGLSVSYYLRASKMYDTLMQMGRWFGYRPGYADLCRLYTSEELANWYVDITVASEELRAEFDYMAVQESRPIDFGLKVRSHPAGLVITATNKLRNGFPMRLSYAGAVSESVAFLIDDRTIRQNLDGLNQFIRGLGSPNNTASSYGGNLLWSGIAGRTIAEFLNGIRAHPRSRRSQPGQLSQYIGRQIGRGELTTWTVALISSTTASRRGEKYDIAGHSIGLTFRERQILNSREYTIRRLVSPPDEALDLSVRELGRLGRGDDPRSQSFPAKKARSIRPKERGLLLVYLLRNLSDEGAAPLVGYAVSFPDSETAQDIEYRVNSIYWQQEFGGLES
jgi:hypothetical protein